MNIYQKAITTLAAGAMVSVALGGVGTFDPANARNKSDKIKPPSGKVKPADAPVENPPAAEYGSQGQHFDRIKPGSRQAVPPPVDDGAVPPSVEYGSQGQHFDKGKPGSRQAVPPPVDDGATPPSAEYGQQGQHFDKGKHGPAGTARKKSDTTKGSGRIVALLGALGGIGGILAVIGGNNSPASPI